MSLRFRFAPHVGYMSQVTGAGNNLMGPVFSTVGQQDAENGTGELDVQQYVPVGAMVPDGKTITEGVDTISLQKLNATGGIDGQLLVWRDSHGEKWTSGRDKLEFKGWYAGSAKTAVENYTVKAGQAVWVNMPAGASCTLQSSGEVAIGDIYMQLNKGNTAACNPMPIDVDIQSVIPYGIGGAAVPDGKTITEGVDTISLQKLNATGGIDGQLLVWRDSHGEKWTSGRDKLEFKGWYAGSAKTPVADYILTAGKGIWVNCPNETTALVFPSVFGKDAE